MSPPYESIGPDALTALVASMRDGANSCSDAGHEVTVDADGVVSMGALAETDGKPRTVTAERSAVDGSRARSEGSTDQ
ncbi:hypothetical protein DVK02_04510 [Halobellus sp. Atlit-31R]|nr:hypothetical protein DVK02_04510 [Halobellus sp. Atlit-31R]